MMKIKLSRESIIREVICGIVLVAFGIAILYGRTPEQRIADIAPDWLTPQLVFKIYMTRDGKEELLHTQVFGSEPVTIWDAMRGDTKFHCEAHANIVNLYDLFGNEE